MTAFETTFEQPERDGRAPGEMDCEQTGCTRQAQTWCPLCQKVLCVPHDELTPRRMHDCLAGPADELD